MLIDKLDPAKLERRIVHLENTIMRLISMNEKLEKDFELKLENSIERIYGRDQEIGKNFKSMVDRHEERSIMVEDRVAELADLIEDVIT